MIYFNQDLEPKKLRNYKYVVLNKITSYATPNPNWMVFDIKHFLKMSDEELARFSANPIILTKTKEEAEKIAELPF